MAQVVVFGHAETLRSRVGAISDAIHAAAVAELALPAAKRFHRFVPLDAGLFVHPDDRSEDYTIVEISMFAGRSATAKRAFVRALYREFAAIGIAGQDLEITITETPRENWGIRGVPADELELDYRIDV